MKQFVFLYVLSSFIFYFECGAGQIMEFPDVFYEKTEFDVVHRGSYNMTDCAAELINCWEIIRPDIVCDYEGSFYESPCGVLRKQCSGRYGAVDVNYGERAFSLTSLVCESNHIYTRRYISIPRNDSKAMALLRTLNYTDAMDGDSNELKSI